MSAALSTHSRRRTADRQALPPLPYSSATAPSRKRPREPSPGPPQGGRGSASALLLWLGWPYAAPPPPILGVLRPIPFGVGVICGPFLPGSIAPSQVRTLGPAEACMSNVAELLGHTTYSMHWGTIAKLWAGCSRGRQQAATNMESGMLHVLQRNS